MGRALHRSTQITPPCASTATAFFFFPNSREALELVVPGIGTNKGLATREQPKGDLGRSNTSGAAMRHISTPPVSRGGLRVKRGHVAEVVLAKDVLAGDRAVGNPRPSGTEGTKADASSSQAGALRARAWRDHRRVFALEAPPPLHRCARRIDCTPASDRPNCRTCEADKIPRLFRQILKGHVRVDAVADRSGQSGPFAGAAATHPHRRRRRTTVHFRPPVEVLKPNLAGDHHSVAHGREAASPTSVFGW